MNDGQVRIFTRRSVSRRIVIKTTQKINGIQESTTKTIANSHTFVHIVQFHF